VNLLNHNKDIQNTYGLISKNSSLLFEGMFQDVSKSLYFTALVILRNSHDAEDAVQDTAISAYNSIDKLKNHNYFKTWITRILINRCKRISSIKKRRDNFLEDPKLVWSVELTSEEIDLWNAIGKLDSTEKMLITMKYVTDLNNNTIAETLNMPLGTVKTKIHRSIQKLKLLLSEE
jgi:RNA polymerase sigma-70 factor, ECF subfamily